MQDWQTGGGDTYTLTRADARALFDAVGLDLHRDGYDELLATMCRRKTALVEIEAQIAKIEEDPRYRGPSATVFANAPLAIIQTELRAVHRALCEVRDALVGAPPPKVCGGQLQVEQLQGMPVRVNGRFTVRCSTCGSITNPAILPAGGRMGLCRAPAEDDNARA